MPSEIVRELPGKRYLGYAVYADFDDWHVVLTTEDGLRATNTIYLEPEVMRALEKYWADIQAAAKNQ